MEQHAFGALIAIEPSAHKNAVQRYLDGTQTHGILQPCSGTYFPAVICPCTSPSALRTVHATVRIPLLAADAQAFFDAGQAFTVWADAIVGDDTIRGEGLIGGGVVVGHEPTVPPSASNRDVPRTTPRRIVPYRRTITQPRTGLAAPVLAKRQ